MKDFRQLQVRVKLHSFTKEVYKCTFSFPKEEVYRVTSQLLRAVVSVTTNIAEGCGRGSDADFKRFV